MAEINFSLSQDLLHELFEYRDGNLLWKHKTRNGIEPGTKAGTLNHHGYVHIRINKKTYQAHRLIFLMHHGYLPEMLDHIDCDRSNNKIENLRPTNNTQNQQNQKLSLRNKTGVKGVCFDKFRGKYLAQIRVNRTICKVGHFMSLDEASKAIKEARSLNHKEFANHG
jgi:hypothetical protein